MCVCVCVCVFMIGLQQLLVVLCHTFAMATRSRMINGSSLFFFLRFSLRVIWSIL